MILDLLIVARQMAHYWINHGDLNLNLLISSVTGYPPHHSLQDLYPMFDQRLKAIQDSLKGVNTIHVPLDAIIVGECKFFKENVDADKVKGILRNFDTYSGCPLFLIVAIEFAQMNKWDTEGYNLWTVEINPSLHDYDMYPYFEDVVPTEEKRNVILISLERISSRPSDSFIQW